MEVIAVLLTAQKENKAKTFNVRSQSEINELI